MTIYSMAISRDLLAISSGYKHTVSMELKCNNKIVLDYLDEKLEELLSDENYYKYIKENGYTEEDLNHGWTFPIKG